MPNGLALAETAETSIRRFLGRCADAAATRPQRLTRVGVAPILPHRKNGLKSRKHKAFCASGKSGVEPLSSTRQADVLPGTHPHPAGILGMPRLPDPAALRHGNGR